MNNLTGNKILKEMISKITGDKKRELLSILSVDIKTCEPIVNPKMTKENKENLCIYLNDNFELVGFLRGSTVLTKYDNIFVKGYRYFARNRKNILQHSTYVLMFTPEMQNVKINSVVNNDIINTRSLEGKLKDYKINKYKHLTVEDMKEIIKTIMLKLHEDLFNNTLPEQFKNHESYAKTTSELISNFAQLVTEFTIKADKYESDIKSLKEQGKENMVNYWSYEDYIQVKNDILIWKNKVA